MTTGQLAAMLSAVYNLGAKVIWGATWPEKYLRGDKAAAQDTFYQWSKDDQGAGLVYVLGLVRRRFSEWQLFTTGSWQQYPPGYKGWFEAHT